jgi:hypothetical protein
MVFYFDLCYKSFLYLQLNYSSFICQPYLFFFLVVLKIELSALCLLSRCFAALVSPSAIFSPFIFELGSCFLPRTLNRRTRVLLCPSIYTSLCSRCARHVPPGPAIGRDRGLTNCLPRLSMNRSPPNLHCPSTQDYRYEPLVPCPNPIFNLDSTFIDVYL